MNVQTVVGLNGDSKNDEGFYISIEDIDFARTYKDQFDNTKTVIYTKAGNNFEVFGSAYHILGIKAYKEANMEVSKP